MHQAENMTYLPPKAPYSETIVYGTIFLGSLAAFVVAAVLFARKRTKPRVIVCVFFLAAALLCWNQTETWSGRQRAKNATDSYSFAVALFISDNHRWPASVEEMEPYAPGIVVRCKIKYSRPVEDAPRTFVVLESDDSSPPYKMTLDHFREYHGDAEIKK